MNLTDIVVILTWIQVTIIEIVLLIMVRSIWKAVRTAVEGEQIERLIQTFLGEGREEKKEEDGWLTAVPEGEIPPEGRPPGSSSSPGG